MLRDVLRWLLPLTEAVLFPTSTEEDALTLRSLLAVTLRVDDAGRVYDLE